MILGDSYTFGVYIADENTYSSQLSNLINKKYNYEVINAGYASGHNTDQQYSWFSNFIKKNGCPEIVILGFFLWNDFAINKKSWKEKDNEGLPIKFIDESIYVDTKNFLRSKKIYSYSCNRSNLSNSNFKRVTLVNSINKSDSKNRET